MFESVCFKRLHAKRILCNIVYLVEDTRLSCWNLVNHSSIDKILFGYELIFGIFKKFMDVGSKGNCPFPNTDNHFSLNYLKYRRIQLSLFISAISSISNILRNWVETAIWPQKLDVLIKITHRISRVLQLPCHQQYFLQ